MDAVHDLEGKLLQRSRIEDTSLVQAVPALPPGRVINPCAHEQHRLATYAMFS